MQPSFIKNNFPKIILGSGSPRRKELLEKMGLDFNIHSLDIDESYPDSIPLNKIASYISQVKMKHLSGFYEKSCLLITADTVVRYKNEVLGKPLNQNESIQMLKKLEGETHIVTTACSLKYREKEIVFSEDTKVHFKHLNNDLLSYYIQNYQALDKAGSYGIQDWIGLIGVEKIIGSYTNVVGLPTARLFEKIIEITE